MRYTSAVLLALPLVTSATAGGAGSTPDRDRGRIVAAVGAAV